MSEQIVSLRDILTRLGHYVDAEWLDEKAQQARAAGFALLEDFAGEPALTFTDAARLYQQLSGRVAQIAPSDVEPNPWRLDGIFEAYWTDAPGLKEAVAAGDLQKVTIGNRVDAYVPTR